MLFSDDLIILPTKSDSEYTYRGLFPLTAKLLAKRWHVLITQLSEELSLTNTNLKEVPTPCSSKHVPQSLDSEGL